eukprot:COSAG03_NODE_17_length_21787_cov_46.088436_3_plen_53_part_00
MAENEEGGSAPVLEPAPDLPAAVDTKKAPSPIMLVRRPSLLRPQHSFLLRSF